MQIVRRTLLSLLGLITLALGAGMSVPAGAATSGATLPQPAVAIPAAQWLASQLSTNGYYPGTKPTTPDLSATVNTVLALAATSVDPTGEQAALSYLEANSASYITVAGSDGPGQLALLILDAEAAGANPTDFGGTNLVARLEATEQTSGTDTGLFGTEKQLKDYYAGTLDQGLALAALKSAGVTANTQEVGWLEGQQCPDGGWVLPSNSTDGNSCTENPAKYTGPDTNTTSAVVEGLAAQGALTATISNGTLAFLKAAQNSDGGWGLQPTNSTDPDSTANVIQALIALGQSPTSATYTVGGSTPVTALESFLVSSGADAGALYFPGDGTTKGDPVATYEAVPALAGLAFPFVAPPDPAPTVTSLSASSGAITGGTTVDITGTNLATAGEVHFGSVAATFTVSNPTLVVATAPPATSPGAVDVTVSTLGGTSASGTGSTFTYAAATSTTTPSIVSGTATTSHSVGSLAVTGMNLFPLLSGGVLLISAGVLMVIPTRRLRRGTRLFVDDEAGSEAGSPSP